MAGIEWHPCASHTLQLVIGKGLMPVKKLILRVKRLINFFSKPKQAERLEDVQKSLPENGRSDVEIKKTDKYLRVIQDCETRWNSSFHAWQRLLLLRDAISILNTKLARETDNDSKKDSKRLKEIMVTTEEWDLIQELVNILEPFAEATDYLGGSSYCTFSSINPIIEVIKKKLTQSPSTTSSTTTSFSSSPLPSPPTSPVTSPPLLPATTEEMDEDAFDETDLEKEFSGQHQVNLNQSVNTSDLLNTVKEKLYENLCLYWNFQDPNTLLATILDPQTKNLKDVSIQVQFEVQKLLRDKVEELKIEEAFNISPSLLTPSDSILTSKTSKYKNSIFAQFRKSQSQVTLDDEVLEYLRLEEINWEENPFTWWAREKNRFHFLSKLACKYLPVPAASTASERMFSDAGNLMGPKRTRMSPELFNRILFLKRNYNMLPSIHPPVSA